MADQNTDYLVTIQQAASADTNNQPITVTAPMPDSFMFDTAASYEAPYAQGLFGSANMNNLAKLGGIRLTAQALTAQIWQGSTETSLGLELEFHTETDPDIDVRTPILALMKMATASVDTTTGGSGSGMLKAPGPQINIDDLYGIAGIAVKQVANSVVSVGSALLKAGSSIVNGMLGNDTNVKPGSMNADGTTLNSTGASNTPNQNSTSLLKSVIRNQISIKIGRYAFFDSVVITNVQKTYSHELDSVTGLPLYAKVSIQFKPLFLLVQSDLDQIFALRGSS